MSFDLHYFLLEQKSLLITTFLVIVQAKIQNPNNEKCSILVYLDHLKNADIYPLIDVFTEMDSFDIEAVDILSKRPCFLKEEYIVSLMHAIDQKLRVVDLSNITLRNDILLSVYLLSYTSLLNMLYLLIYNLVIALLH